MTSLGRTTGRSIESSGNEQSAALSAHIEDTYGFGKRMAFVWLSDGASGYRLTMPIDLAGALCERLGGPDQPTTAAPEADAWNARHGI